MGSKYSLMSLEATRGMFSNYRYSWDLNACFKKSLMDMAFKLFDLPLDDLHMLRLPKASYDPARWLSLALRESSI